MRKRPGRPRDGQQEPVSDALLAAAERCLAIKRYKDIRVRDIAELADVNPAMINYYFSTKEGLFIALIGHLISAWEEGINGLISTANNSLPQLTSDLVDLIDSCFYRHKLVIRLLSRELLDEESGISRAYRNKLASRIATGIRRFIETTQRRGLCRQNIILRPAAMDIANITIHPIALENSQLQEAYGIRPQELTSRRWLNHLKTMVLAYLGP